MGRAPGYPGSGFFFPLTMQISTSTLMEPSWEEEDAALRQRQCSTNLFLSSYAPIFFIFFIFFYFFYFFICSCNTTLTWAYFILLGRNGRSEPSWRCRRPASISRRESCPYTSARRAFISTMSCVARNQDTTEMMYSKRAILVQRMQEKNTILACFIHHHPELKLATTFLAPSRYL